jgi:hypothetical protein
LLRKLGKLLLLASHKLFEWSSPARHSILVLDGMCRASKSSRTRDTVELGNTALLVYIDMLSGSRHGRGVIVRGL